MLYCVLGTPSAFSAYGALLVRALVERAKGDILYLPVCTPDELKSAFAARGNRPVVLFSDSLDRRITELLLRVGAPVLLLLDDVFDAIGYTMQARSVDVRVSIQMFSQSVSCLSALVGSSQVTVVHRPSGPAPPRLLVDELCRLLGLELSLADSVTRKFVPAGNDPSRETIDGQIERHVPKGRPSGGFSSFFDDSDRALIEAATAAYVKLLGGAPLDSLLFQWPPLLFRDSWAVNDSVSGPMVMVGPARYLMFGPLLHLPVGFWRATAILRVSENLSGNTIMSDVVADNAIVAVGEGELPASGDFAYSMDFPVTDPRHPVALRIAIRSGAIEGSIELLSADCTLGEATDIAA